MILDENDGLDDDGVPLDDDDDGLLSFQLPDGLVRAMDLQPGEEGYEEAKARGLTSDSK